MSSYAQADRFTQLTYDEIGFLKNIAYSLPENAVFVNLGAGHGTSGLAVAEARPDIKITTVDRTFDGPTGSLMGERNAFHKGVEEGLYPMPEQILSDSAEAGRNWQGGQIDALFIDAGHLYSECRADWDAWNEHVKPGGVIAFHDYKSVWGPGVLATVEEIQDGLALVGLVDTLIAFRKPNG